VKKISSKQWGKMLPSEKCKMVESAKKNELDMVIQLPNSTYIFIGGCVTCVEGTNVYVYPNGKKTKLWSEDEKTNANNT
jgi:hypothetical protein